MKIASALLFLQSWSLLVTADPCSQIQVAEPLPIQVMLDCLNNVPVDASKKSEMLKQLKYYVKNFYVFEDRSFGGTDGKQPILDVLEQLQHSDHSSEYELFLDIHLTIQSFKDSHMSYFSPCFNQAFGFWTGLPLFVVYEERPRVLVSNAITKGLNEYYVSTYGIDLWSYVGEEVSHINGVPALEALKEFAQNFGLSRDYNSDFNSALTRSDGDPSEPNSGNWASRTLPPMKPNLKVIDTFVYTLCSINEQTAHQIAIPVISVKLAGNSFNSTQDLIDECLTFKEEKQEAVNALPQTVSSSPSPVSEFPPFPPFPGVEPVNVDSVYNGQYFQIFTLSDDIGVYNIKSFGLDYKDVIPEFVESFQIIQDANFKKIILDVRGNIGGSWAVVSFILAYLLNSTIEYQNSHASKNHPFLKEIIEKEEIVPGEISGWKPQYYLNKETLEPHDSVSFLQPDPIYPGYTIPALNNLNYQNRFTTMIKNPLGSSPLAMTDLAILTDGICFSGCALLSETLSSYGVRTFGLGGFPSDTLWMGTAFAPVIGISDLRENLRKLNITCHHSNSECVDPPPYLIDFKWSDRRMYNDHRDAEEILLEYLPLPVDCVIRPTLEDIYNETSIWKKIVSFMSWGTIQ